MLYMGTGRDWFVTVEFVYDWLVTVVRKPKNGLPLYYMSFYQRIKPDTFKKVFEYETIDSFQTAYTTIEQDRLLTIWSTGSAHRLRIFWADGRAIQEVLSVGWKGEPEFVHLTQDNELAILIPVEDFSQPPPRKPKFAERYQWTGKGYVLVDTVPWEARFKALRRFKQTPK